MRELTASEIEAVASEADVPLRMDEEAFAGFYERTSRPLWAYLARATGDRQLAEDLLQEAYYRLLRSETTFEGEQHRRHYLFRVAVNLVRDAQRRRRVLPAPAGDSDQLDRHPHPCAHEAPEDRAGFAEAMARLRPRDRALLWLAYAQGSSHQEIAASIGVATGSIKPMLSRARHRLATLLGARRVGRRPSASPGAALPTTDPPGGRGA
jgi:RNA polymerase sigma-70 factor (ECF subfamily)